MDSEAVCFFCTSNIYPFRVTALTDIYELRIYELKLHIQWLKKLPEKNIPTLSQCLIMGIKMLHKKIFGYYQSNGKFINCRAQTKQSDSPEGRLR